MPLGTQPQCSACKINKSVIWRKGVNGETLCNGCHLKRVNSFLRSQRHSAKEARRTSSKLRGGRGKGSNGRHGDRSTKAGVNRINRRTLFKQKVNISHSNLIDPPPPPWPFL